MSGLWWNIIQLFGRLIPYRILKPLTSSETSRNIFLDFVNSPIMTDIDEDVDGFAGAGL